MAFRGKYPIRAKIIIYNEPVEQISNFKYPGNDISYDTNVDIQIKLAKFHSICGIIQTTLKVGKGTI